MRYLKLFEEFEEMKKPSLLQRAVKGTKRFFGYEKKEDRETIEKIHRIIDSPSLTSGGYKVNFVKSIKEIKPGVIVAWLLTSTTGSLTVDTNENTIMFDGKELELSDMEYECQSLYSRLKSILNYQNF